METAAFDTLAAARELEAAGMDRHLAEVTALNMHKAGTAHLDQLATKADLENHQNATEAKLENHRVATKGDIETGLANLKSDMLKVALGIVIANAAFVVANTGIVIALVKFL